MELKKIIYIGPVGSGKSTQADLLAEKLVIPHIQMGELLRASTDPEIQKIVASGALVPDQVTMKLLADELDDPRYENGFIIDGVPRTIYQAQNLPFDPDIVIYLAVRDSENIKRLLLRKRADDTEEVIKKRLEVYHEETTPVLDFYRAKGKFLEINGEPLIEVIFEDILKRLELT
ncbi:nucleoside monophosphate kinase [Candidatus Microgenomates bacterium]|nr:nucleoside monophosphate kinase [Candidatus Microgenomates bacterium]